LHITKIPQGTSLVAQWLKLCTPNVGGPGLIPCQETINKLFCFNSSYGAGDHAARTRPKAGKLVKRY